MSGNRFSEVISELVRNSANIQCSYELDVKNSVLLMIRILAAILHHVKMYLTQVPKWPPG